MNEFSDVLVVEIFEYHYLHRNRFLGNERNQFTVGWVLLFKLVGRTLIPLNNLLLGKEIVQWHPVS